MRIPDRHFALISIALAILTTITVPSCRTSAASVGAKPLPAGPKAYTERDYAIVRLKWRREITVEPYQALGPHNPAWDNAALELVEVYGRWAAMQPDAPSAEQFLAAAHPLMNTACDDPLVLYCIGVALQENGRLNEAEPYLRWAIERYERVPYPKAIALAAPFHLAEVCQAAGEEKAAEADKWLALAAEWIGEATRERKWSGPERRVFWGNVEAMLNRALGPKAKQVYEAVTCKAGADEWLANMIGGQYRIMEAWKARGGGWAYTVTEQGWKIFFEQLELARAHLTKAWRLHPEYPEAAAGMMTVVTGADDGPGALRLWFDRSVAAQLDYMCAYQRFLTYSLPRWGGSHEEMYDFGLECLATKRFDTRVPEVLWDAVWTISDCDDTPHIWRQAGLYENLRIMFEGMAAEPSNAKRVAEIRSRQLAAAWRCGAYDDARRLLEEMGGQVSDTRPGKTVFETTFRIPKERALGEVYAATGPLAAQVRKAEAMYQAGKPDAALPLFQESAAQNSERRADGYLRERVAACRIEAELVDGGWVALTPAQNLEAWQVHDGQWEVAGEGAIRALRPNGYGVLLCAARMPADFEMRGEVAFQPSSPALAGGIRYGVNRLVKGQRIDMLISFNGSISFFGRKGSIERQRPGTEESNTFLLQVWDSKMKVHVNGRLVFEDREVGSRFNSSLPGQVGLVTWDAEPRDTAVLFKNVQVRRLTRPPS